jgi:hypothetical protein
MSGGDGGMEGGRVTGRWNQKWGPREGQDFSGVDVLACTLSWVLGTNERFISVKGTAVRLSTSNSAYTQRVKWMKEYDKWKDQHGKLVTEVTSEESIRLSVKEITTKTKDTPISYQQERVVKVCRNDLAPLFDKIVDKDDKIPSDNQVSDIQEELCVTYFNSLTSDNPPDQVSSEDETTKTERLDDITKARVNKLD